MDVNEVYLDNSATTRVADEVRALMDTVMSVDYGNPSSLHKMGVQSALYIRQAKERISRTLKASDQELIFTSCGTEADNLAIIGYALANPRAGKHMITSVAEHPAVLESMRVLESIGYEVTYLPVDESGKIRISDLKEAVRPDTALAALMYVNNEVGAVAPIEEAAEVIKQRNKNTVIFTDAVQAYGKLSIRPKSLGVDMMSASSHKIHGPKGCGFLYVKSGIRLKPLMPGGGQQKGMRSGTENVPGIAGMGLAAKLLYDNLDADQKRMYELKAGFIDGLRKINCAVINGPACEDGAPHIVNVSFRGIRSEVMLHALEQRGIYVSSGSACSSNHPGKSRTLAGMGLKDDLADSAVRFSLSVYTTRQELDYTLAVLNELIPVLSRFTRF